MAILYIHAGLPKTGTTALQTYFLNNREIILKKSNLYYPKIGLSGYVDKHNDFFPIHEKIFNELVQEIQPYKPCDILISSENISRFRLLQTSLREIEVIQRALPGYTIKFVVYATRLDTYAKKWFNQRVKLNIQNPHAHATYAGYLKEALTPSSGGDSLYFSKIIAHMHSLVGRENVLVGLYSRELLVNQDIIHDFFALLGKPVPEICADHSHTSINPSLPATMLPYLTYKVLPRYHDDPLRKEIVSLLEHAYVNKNVLPWDEYTKIGEEEIDRIESLVPGYKKLYENKPLSFQFPEAEPADQHQLFMTSLLYSLLTRVDTLSRYFFAFPNSRQKFLLAVYRPFIRLFCKKKRYRLFKKSPKEFFATSNGKHRMIIKLLEMIGPKIEDSAQ